MKFSMQQALTILMAQINPTVGAIAANTEKIITIIEANQQRHDVIVFPELALSGYPPEDLLFRKNFYLEIADALGRIAACVQNCHVVVGHPSLENGQCYNTASIFYQKKRLAVYHKQHLPNYGVFDELRYFTSVNTAPCIFMSKNYRLGVCICEDIWREGPADDIVKAGADVLICINASPFDYTKYALRENLIREYAKRGLAIIYVNQTGGQDELVFDGQSIALDHEGKVRVRAAAFKEDLQTVTLQGQQLTGHITPLYDQDQLIYEALICGLRDYIEKNNFPGVLLGLSGGIDSALCLTLAVDALGAARVHAVMMPSRYTSSISTEDAQQLLQNLNVKSSTLSIEPAFKTLLKTLSPAFANLPVDITEENLQARIRGTLLMALSNKTGNMVLCTSNKSETAVGYTTLYGDMVGGLAILKDVLKTQVYALAHYRNRRAIVIPERILTRPPSAELAKNQTDQDSLPDYGSVDAIIKAYMENNQSAADIIQAGYPAHEVNKVIQLIKCNEYKRRQAAPCIKISPRAFGRDWRYPITSGFRA